MTCSVWTTHSGAQYDMSLAESHIMQIILFWTFTKLFSKSNQMSTKEQDLEDLRKASKCLKDRNENSGAWEGL